jgi:hypothetical protein
MSNKSIHIKPQYLEDPIYYRKAKSDLVRGIVGFFIITLIMFVVMSAVLLTTEG